ncbi:phosphinothricin N-acetyltransferase [Streptococcus dysgalactiae subsp. equisimilis]|nr:phosphinothricin acetyltransferase [Streptococcus dysgalactiae]SQF68695.1 phosphinothricin N-acetyltransferase [Streptococcus dysgalactiae subsp. equisimilis]SQF78833.1 phosphinothricin N-acetyltransferase [Streptococcus dysgalactiae subsp. equisimilis]SUN71550.1 phosphinothricin N-acetyltransferase [Streptococcus dysgalactiae]VTT06040.1 phosphinothricin N-acetyltransferase [Streptococcus dysgalactiae subsp. equisimilis]
MSVSVRLATLEDAEALLAIYAPYVTDTAVTFDYEVPT